MRILGIDPGYGITGFGIVEAQRGACRLLRCGAITTPPNTDFNWRLGEIYNNMTELMQLAQAWPLKSCSLATMSQPALRLPRPGASFCWQSSRRVCPCMSTSPCRSSKP